MGAMLPLLLPLDTTSIADGTLSGGWSWVAKALEGIIAQNHDRQTNTTSVFCLYSGRVAGTCPWLGVTRSATPPPLWIAHWISALLVLMLFAAFKARLDGTMP